jgi:hypothetical protein
VQEAEHLALDIGLPYGDRQAQFRARTLAQPDQVGVGLPAVDVGLAGAEAAQVGAVEDIDVHAHTSS